MKSYLEKIGYKIISLPQSMKLEDSICLEECLETLSDSDRRIIDLRYYKAQTQSVVAKKLGMSQVQVSRREKRILREIREKMSV
jgi:RNA polymerase sporulation-specific sigma factor